MNPDQRSLDGGEAPLAIARRHAKPCGGSANSLDANLTAEGVEVLGVEPGDLLLVEVFGDLTSTGTISGTGEVTDRVL